MNNPIFARFLAWASEREERSGGDELRRRLLAGLSGRVLEIGPGNGVSFPYYPQEVTELVAVEPEPHLREVATGAARSAPVPTRVVEGTADELPAEDGEFDAVVVAGVLCSVPDQARALAEIARVLKPTAELRFFEHVAARQGRLARFQDLLDATVWPSMFGGCHPNRDTETELLAAGFVIDWRERFSFRPTPVSFPVAPRILGAARPQAGG
jgi:ubiquinone/menaquinone biosynthesis C-methylase UbiE